MLKNIILVLDISFLLLILYGYFGPGKRRWEVIIYPLRFWFFRRPRRRGGRYSPLGKRLGWGMESPHFLTEAWLGPFQYRLWTDYRSVTGKSVRLCRGMDPARWGVLDWTALFAVTSLLLGVMLFGVLP